MSPHDFNLVLVAAPNSIQQVKAKTFSVQVEELLAEENVEEADMLVKTTAHGEEKDGMINSFNIKAGILCFKQLSFEKCVRQAWCIRASLFILSLCFPRSCSSVVTLVIPELPAVQCSSLSMYVTARVVCRCFNGYWPRTDLDPREFISLFPDFEVRNSVLPSAVPLVISCVLRWTTHSVPRVNLTDQRRSWFRAVRCKSVDDSKCGW